MFRRNKPVKRRPVQRQKPGLGSQFIALGLAGALGLGILHSDRALSKTWHHLRNPNPVQKAVHQQPFQRESTPHMAISEPRPELFGLGAQTRIAKSQPQAPLKVTYTPQAQPQARANAVPAPVVREQQARVEVHNLEPVKPIYVHKPPMKARAGQHNVLIYHEGLSGRALANAYRIEYTTSWRFTPNAPLLNDVKVLLTIECEKYNRKSSFNPRGEKLVEPYDVFAAFSIECNFNPNAIGGSREQGIGQLTQATIKTLADLPELPVVITNPFDLKQGIAGAVRQKVWLKREMNIRANFELLVGYNQGHSYANNPTHIDVNKQKARKAGEVYANKAMKAIADYRQKRALAGFI